MRKQTEIDCAIGDIRCYAKEYECSLENALEDYINEEPLEEWLVEALKLKICTRVDVEKITKYKWTCGKCQHTNESKVTTFVDCEYCHETYMAQEEICPDVAAMFEEENRRNKK